MTRWFEHSAWWHIYPLGFLGAEKEFAGAPSTVNGSRLRALKNWLPYIKELGCNGLLLAPIFASESHGYDTIDHYSIDPRLGSDSDFEYLIEQAGDAGIKIVLDGVFNHVGRKFAPFEDVQTFKQSSQYADWFHIDWNQSGNADGFSYKNFEGHDRLVTLNHSNNDVTEYVVDVMTYWLKKGVAGWRLDAAYAVPSFFWQKTIAKVKEEFPDAWFLGEVIHGDYSQIAKQSGFDSITQYELWKGIWSALNDRNFFELSHALTRHDQFSQSFLPNTFIGNHDVTRIASQLKNINHLDLAIAILGTVPGVPSIYAGDEQGFTGIKEHREGGDDAIRTEFPANPELFPEAGWKTFQKYKQALEIRRARPWLAHGKFKALVLQNTFFVYEISSGNERLIVALNCGDASATINDATTVQKIAECEQNPILGNVHDGGHILANNAVVWQRSC